MIIETRDDHEEKIIEHYNFCAEVNTISSSSERKRNRSSKKTRS